MCVDETCFNRVEQSKSESSRGFFCEGDCQRFVFIKRIRSVVQIGGTISDVSM